LDCFLTKGGIMKKVFICLIVGVALLVKSSFGQVNPIKELATWTVEQSIGITSLYSTETKNFNTGYYWGIFKSEHDWLGAGLVAEQNNQLVEKVGIGLTFNVGKLIEKLKGSPMVYLKHLYIGYYKTWGIDSNFKDDNGFMVNLIKWEFK